MPCLPVGLYEKCMSHDPYQVGEHEILYLIWVELALSDVQVCVQIHVPRRQVAPSA